MALHTVPHDKPGHDAQIESAYQTYFASGTYDRRYPTPNRTIWRRILAHVGLKTALLDFGCGSGRYLLPLQGRVGAAAGFDVSTAALDLLRAGAAAQAWGELKILGPDIGALSDHIAQQGPVDVILCLFGVLGHVTDPTARAEALTLIRQALKPGTGRLLVSVPNRARRFRAEQSGGGEGGLVRYSRDTGAAEITLSYQLFDPAGFRAELEGAGFKIHRMACESVLPENWLLHSAAAKWVDAMLSPICPARFGYGIYAEVSC